MESSIKIIFIAGLVLLLSGSLSAQKWTNIIVNEQGIWINAVAQSHDEGFIMTGQATISREPYIDETWILKMNKYGTIIWKNTIGESEWDIQLHFVYVIPEGGYFIGGNVWMPHTDYSQWDAFLIKIDEDGTILWQKKYGGKYYDSFDTMTYASNGEYIIAGYSSEGKWIVQINSKGAIVWQKKMKIAEDAYINSIAATPDGGFIIAGTYDWTIYYDRGQEYRSCLVVTKFNEKGDPVWTKRYQGYDNYWHSYIFPHSDGSYTITGTRTKRYSNHYAPYILKLNNKGNIIWKKMYYGWADIAFASSASSTKDGGYVITGCSWRSHCCNYSFYAYLLKVNNAGNPQWIKKYEVEGSEVIGRALASTKDGGAIITGDYEGNDKIPYGSIIIKTDASGDTSKICLNVSNGEAQQKDIEISSYEASTVCGLCCGIS